MSMDPIYPSAVTWRITAAIQAASFLAQQRISSYPALLWVSSESFMSLSFQGLLLRFRILPYNESIDVSISPLTVRPSLLADAQLFRLDEQPQVLRLAPEIFNAAFLILRHEDDNEGERKITESGFFSCCTGAPANQDLAGGSQSVVPRGVDGARVVRVVRTRLHPRPHRLSSLVRRSPPLIIAQNPHCNQQSCNTMINKHLAPGAHI